LIEIHHIGPCYAYRPRDTGESDAATAREINENTFRAFEAFGVVTLVYLVIALMAWQIMHRIVRAGFRSISPGQYSASEALGLSKLQAYAHILFPQAIRNVLPILLTQSIVLFQETSLVNVISATDLRGAAAKIAQRDGRLLEMYLTVGVTYFLLCYAASQCVKQLPGRLAYRVRRWSRSSRSRSSTARSRF
jgi:glutamate/aspartate transport system permease protein